MGKIEHVVCFRSRKASPGEEYELPLREEYSAFACPCLLDMISRKILQLFWYQPFSLEICKAEIQ